MKKIVLIGMLGIVLAGCDDAKATKEKFLLGKWHCNLDIIERYENDRDDNGHIYKQENTISYKMIDGKLNIVAPNGVASPVSELSGKDEDSKEKIVEGEFGKTISKYTFTKINDNQYRYIIEEEFKKNANSPNVLDQRSKIVTTCTRIK